MALTAVGLTNGGVTTHYRFQYDDSLKAGGLEPSRTNMVIDKCESDFNWMHGLFGNIDPGVNIPISVLSPVANPGRVRIQRRAQPFFRPATWRSLSVHSTSIPSTPVLSVTSSWPRWWRY